MGLITHCQTTTNAWSFRYRHRQQHIPYLLWPIEWLSRNIRYSKQQNGDFQDFSTQQFSQLKKNQSQLFVTDEEYMTLWQPRMRLPLESIITNSYLQYGILSQKENEVILCGNTREIQKINLFNNERTIFKGNNCCNLRIVNIGEYFGVCGLGRFIDIFDQKSRVISVLV